MITAHEVGRKAYSEIMAGVDTHMFNTPQYAGLYTHRCCRLHYIVLADSRVRAGIIAGERDDQLQSPFSAPYGGLVLPRPLRFPLLAEAAQALDDYARSLSLGLRITLPPEFHTAGQIAAQAFAFGRLKEICTVTDLNYHLPLSRTTDITARMAPSAREALQRAVRSGLRFDIVPTDEAGVRRVYALIEAHHAAHGYPMSVPLPDMIRTCLTFGAELFTVATADGRDVAAAIVYRPWPHTAQPVAWGDLDAWRPLRPMTLLAASLARYYAAEGLTALDLGPASQHGLPDPGLCFFKETLGSLPSLRHTFLRRP